VPLILGYIGSARSELMADPPKPTTEAVRLTREAALLTLSTIVTSRL